jgi:hypothetical protein
VSSLLHWNDDFRDLVAELEAARAEFVIVGAHALAVHGVPRATGDLDVLVRPTAENAHRVLQALGHFGAPVDVHQLSVEDLTRPGTVYQIGLPPRRIDLLTEISGVSFDEAWQTRTEVEVEGRPVPFLGRDALIKNKRAAGRDKDLTDVRLLERRSR